MTARLLSIPERAARDPKARNHAIDRMVLALLYDAGGEMPFADLWKALPCTRREVWRSLHRQYDLGNVRRHRSGEPIILTHSAIVAISAGRNIPPLFILEAA